MIETLTVIGCVFMGSAMIFGVFIGLSGLIGVWRIRQITRQHEVKGFKSWDMPDKP